MANSAWFWNRIAKTFASHPLENEALFRETVDRIRGRLRDGHHLLDFACGTGTLSIELAGSVEQIVGLDISTNMLAFARQRTEARGIGNISYVNSTIFDERFQNESFDVVLAFNVMHFFRDSETVLSRVHDLLKPGGLFISETPCLKHKMKLFNVFMYILSKVGILPYMKIMDSAELEAMITACNFTIIEKRHQDINSRNYFLIAAKTGP